MAQAMDVVLSAVATDLVGRLISFLVRKYKEPGATEDAEPGAAEDVVRLQRAMLRAGAVVEEAEGRQIPNRAMLQQLNQLRRDMYRGTYVLDALSWGADEDPTRKRHAAARRQRPFSLPLRSGGSSVVAESLEAALGDMREFVVLLGGCPRVARQPYSAYLFMERCMFGRQMEKEQIISFLLQPAHQDLDVLPIIGPHKVGKRTLVEHVCLDKRVRQCFTKIHRLSSDSLDDQPSHDHGRRHLSLIDGNARSLIVISLADDNAGEEEERWRKFHRSVRRRAHRESKIILISRSEAAHVCLGTVPPLRLRAPRREDVWYFFRTLAFGAADPAAERPELLRVAMALFAVIQDDPAVLSAASIIAALLRADMGARSWRHVLDVYAGGAMDPSGVFLCRPVRGSPGILCSFHGTRKLTCAARSEVLPRVTLVDLVVIGGAVGGGGTRFDVLVWQSRIPPYASYVATCDATCDMEERGRHVADVGEWVAVEKEVRKRRRGQQDEERDVLAEIM